MTAQAALYYQAGDSFVVMGHPRDAERAFRAAQCHLTDNDPRFLLDWQDCQARIITAIEQQTKEATK